MLVKSALFMFTLITSTGCGGGGDSNGSENTETASLHGSGGTSASPLDSGDGFVFGVAELYSNKALADVAHIGQDETPRLGVLHSGLAYLPFHHTSGASQ